MSKALLEQLKVLEALAGDLGINDRQGYPIPWLNTLPEPMAGQLFQWIVAPFGLAMCGLPRDRASVMGEPIPGHDAGLAVLAEALGTLVDHLAAGEVDKAAAFLDERWAEADAFADASQPPPTPRDMTEAEAKAAFLDRLRRRDWPHRPWRPEKPPYSEQLRYILAGHEPVYGTGACPPIDPSTPE